MAKLSDHFHDYEFACKDNCGDMEVVPQLITGLEHLRTEIGKPIIVVSGKRCAVRNAAVGGAKDSQHLLGMAADIKVKGVPLQTLLKTAMGVIEFYMGGIGLYPDDGFVHVDVRGTRARWGRLNGRYCSLGEAWSALDRTA